MGYHVTFDDAAFNSDFTIEQIEETVKDKEYVGFSKTLDIIWTEAKDFMIVPVEGVDKLSVAGLFGIIPYGGEYFFKYREEAENELEETVAALIKPGTTCVLSYVGEEGETFGSFIDENGIHDIGKKLIVKVGEQWYDADKVTSVKRVKVNGIECRFTDQPRPLPWFQPNEKFPFLFDIRHDDEQWEPCNIEPEGKVFVNYFGTILSPVDFLKDAEDGYVAIRDCPECGEQHPDFIYL